MGGAEAQQEGAAVIVIHVDHGDVRLPVGENGIGLGEAGRGPNDEESVIQRQLDEVDDERSVVEHQGAPRLGLACVRLALGHGQPPHRRVVR